MLRNEAPRPTFLLPSVVAATGRVRPVEHYGGLGIFGQIIPDSQAVEAWWAAIEPLALVLNLAGYDTPEVVVAHFEDPDSYLRLLAWPGLVPQSPAHLRVEQGDWRALTGAAVALTPAELGGKLVAALRVKARRWIEKLVGGASPYPALPLTGLVPDYVPNSQTPIVEPPDPFATTADGWIILTQQLVLPAGTAQVSSQARSARDAIAGALAAAPPATGGLRACLDRDTWDSARQRELKLEAFGALADEIWAHLQTPGTLASWLKKEPAAADATAAGLLGRARGVDPDWLKKAGMFEAARAELEARHAAFHPKEANGLPLLAHFETMHWLVALFVLHAFGLVTLLPFGVTDAEFLPSATAAGDLPPVDVTGLYETPWGEQDEADRLVNTTLQLNQAGPWLDGWITDRQGFRHEFAARLVADTWRPSEGNREPLLRFDGSFDGDSSGWIKIYKVTHPDQDNAYELALGYGIGAADPVDLATLVRQGRRARLRPSLLAEALPVEVAGGLSPQVPPEMAWTTPRGRLESDLTPLHSA